jgi:hypothetical protein
MRMRTSEYLIALLAVAGGTSPLMLRAPPSEGRIVYVVDTVLVRASPTPLREASVDYDEIVSRVIERMARQSKGTAVVDGDLIVKGRLGVGGPPEPGTEDPVTVHAAGSANILFLANEALRDPQRMNSQHRHVGTVGVAQDGGLRLGQNTICYSGPRGCAIDDRFRRQAHAGFDSMGDMSFFVANVDSLTGIAATPGAQSLVLKLLDWDGNIHIVSQRPGQHIYFNGSTALNSADLQWEVPLH